MRKLKNWFIKFIPFEFVVGFIIGCVLTLLFL